MVQNTFCCNREFWLHTITRKKQIKKSAAGFFTSTPILSSAEIKTTGNHILIFLNI